MKRVAAVVALLCGLLLLGSAPAGAACLGPSIEYESGPVRRGGTVTVTGSGFGDNCYDTGPPPAGEGYLGKPLTEIEVVLVQSDRQTVVARGAADEGYAFEIDVVVPVGSFPGEARLLALDAATGLTAAGDPERPVLITPDPPLATDQPMVRFEGSDQRPSTTIPEIDDRDAEATSNTPPPQPSAGDDSDGGLVVFGLGALAAMGLLAAMTLARRRGHH